MSVKTTLEKYANASLALIAIIGWAVQGLLATWPADSPTLEWVAIIIGLGSIAFAFYREDKAYKKDPGIKEATVTAATDELMNTFAEVLVSRVVDKVVVEGKGNNNELQAEINGLKTQLARLEKEKLESG
jgi:hypothetical protein